MTNIHLKMLNSERNIYEVAELFNQNRYSVSEIIEDLASPNVVDGSLLNQSNFLECVETKQRFKIEDRVIDFRNGVTEIKDEAWTKANAEFLHYHRSLTLYTLINGLPLINYLREKTGIADLKNATVIDVGAGTGHTLCTFFKHPASLKYYNIDPNLRLLHDQFVRIYPELLNLKMGHLLCYAEQLPFKSGCADLVMSMTSIDHFKDYQSFMNEAFRVLKVGGRIFITSHLDLPPEKRVQSVSAASKLFSYQFWERVARFLYYRRYRVGADDHTFHFEDMQPILDGLLKSGFKIQDKEEFSGNFWITAVKS